MTPTERLGLATALALAAVLLLMILLVTSGAGRAAGIIYKYVQQDGTTVYTEQWDQVPAVYRAAVQRLDGDTLEPIVPSSGVRATPAPTVTTAPPPVRRATRPTPPQESWGVMAEWLGPVIQQISAMNLAFPNHTQLGLGLTMFSFIAAIFFVLRMTEHRVAKVALRALLVMLVTGTVYTLFLTNFAEEFTMQAGTIDQAARPARKGTSVAGQSPSHREQNASWYEKINPLSSLDQSVQESRDTALEKARAAATQAHQANQQLEQRLADLEPESHAASATGQTPSSAPASSPRAPNLAPAGQSPAPQQAHEAVAQRVRDAEGQINSRPNSLAPRPTIRPSSSRLGRASRAPPKSPTSSPRTASWP
ncbi:MAG: hypothetical protein HZB35_12455 [Nitrospirae bacterium]|nr:hypothetical protein [Nitrospirota bacterium]